MNRLCLSKIGCLILAALTSLFCAYLIVVCVVFYEERWENLDFSKASSLMEKRLEFPSSATNIDIVFYTKRHVINCKISEKDFRDWMSNLHLNVSEIEVDNAQFFYAARKNEHLYGVRNGLLIRFNEYLFIFDREFDRLCISSHPK